MSFNDCVEHFVLLLNFFLFPACLLRKDRFLSMLVVTVVLQTSYFFVLNEFSFAWNKYTQNSTILTNSFLKFQKNVDPFCGNTK